jgi:hypothetical protein
MNKTTINQFVQEIEEIGEKYLIGDFVKSLRRRLVRRGIDFWGGLGDMRGLVNPMVAIMQAKNSLSSEETLKVVAVMSDLRKKYRYDEYVRECDEARKNFLGERKNYFSTKLSSPSPIMEFREENEQVSIAETIEDFMGVGEAVISSWIDSVLSRIKPETLIMEYEDLDGEVHTMEVCHEPIRVTKDHVSAPLIDRYTGKTQFDSFLLRSFFDCKKKKWCYVPVRFIMNVKSPSSKETI